MALEGTLRDFSLADIFQLIGLQRKTGVLTLRGKDDNVTVTFLDGKVVGADSSSHRLETRLGHVLMKSGMLTQEQLTRALEIQKETLQRLGFILTHYQIISTDSLKQALQLQILQIIYRLFRWKDGEYHFSQETTIEYDRDNVVPISAESILMEGARMIDEWPIIEKRIRSANMVFRRKNTGAEIVVVGGDDVDEVDFDTPSAGVAKRKKTAGGTERIRISAEEKQVLDLLDGKRTVGDIIEMSRLSEFDTSKALYELLTRDLIEEVRTAAPTPSAEAAAPVDELEVAETPVPLPLVLFLAVIAIGLLVTSYRNPLNSLRPINSTRNSAPVETVKAISIERIHALGNAIEQYNTVNGHLPARLQDLTPYFISQSQLTDPWGNAYKYLQQPSRYLVIGFTSDGKADTDLFLSRGVEAGATASAPTKQERGGITLID